MDRKLTDLELIRIKKAEELQKKNINPWSRKTSYSDTSFTLKEKFQSLSNEELEKTKSNVSVMVRIMIKRGPFVVGKDSFGRIQAFVSKKETPQIMSFVHSLDVGDIVFIKGSMMKTHTGELTIRTKELELITKSLKPLPEKFHGLKDVEERYRRRYLDLIMNDHVKETFWTRHKIVALVRKYFDEQNYFAAETPVLHDVLGGANARPFSTQHNALSMDFYLRIATEIPLKKLVVGGFEKVYEIGRLFRNEGIDTSHNPEFTTVEFYQAYSNLDKMMEQTENLFRFVAKGINKKKIVYNNIEIDFAKPFRKVNMVEAINHKTGLDFSKISLAKAREAAKTHKLEVKPYFKLGHIVNLFFEELIEPDLEQPTFIYNYPVEVSPLASRNLKDPRFADRAELFIAGKEYANMFTELNDPFDQMERFESQLKERYSGNDEANEIDLDFIEALEYGMPPTGGCGVGIDRMVMLLTGNHSIREVLLFPHLKHKKGHRQNNG